MLGEAEEHQYLIHLYREMGDVELLHLAHATDDLTPIAQDVLRAELSARHLKPPTQDDQQTEIDTTTSLFGVASFARIAPDDCIWEFPEREDAQAAAEMLSEAEINYDLLFPDGLDLRLPRIAVFPDDVDKARELLARPIPEEYRTLVRTHREFEVPSCRRCGAPDPLLESIDPTNQWHAIVAATLGLTIPSIRSREEFRFPQRLSNPLLTSSRIHVPFAQTQIDLIGERNLLLRQQPRAYRQISSRTRSAPLADEVLESTHLSATSLYS